MKLMAQLDDDLPLLVAARGSFADKTTLEWTGALTQLHMDRASSQRFLHLDGEAALAIGSTHWSIGPMRLQSRQAAIKFNANAVTGKMQLALAAENPSIGRASLDLSASPADVWALSAQTPWQGKLQAAISDLAWANDLIGSPWQANGRLDADVKIAGTPQFPLINGQISGSQLGLRNLDTRMVLQNGSLRASIRDSILMLDEFNADSVLTQPPPALQRTLVDKGQSLIEKPGRISAQGRMKLGAMGPGDTEQLRLDVTLDRLGISQTPRQWLLLSGQGKLNWQQAKLGVEAKLGVDAAHWQLADLSRPQLSDDVVVHREGNTSTEVRRTTPWTGTVQVGLGRNFSFEGAGARGRLTGQVRVIASAQDLPRASGTVNLVNGRYEAYGQQLDIERGILNFQGLLENPALNILALRKGLPVEAGVEITGFAQAPRIRLVSEPNVPDTEKLSWLVLGRPPSQEGGDAGVLMAAVGAIFGNQSSSASQHIKDSFGIDEISVRSGNIGQMQAMNSRVVSMSSSSQNTGQILAVGKQLSDRLRLSYEQALGGADSLVKLTLKVTEQISVVGTSGTDAALDVFYGFSFGGAPSKTK
jgi:translocation and assembly module TamB